LKVFGVEIRRAREEKAMQAIPQRGGWFRIFEPFTGAWQRNMSEDHGTLLNYPTLYACIRQIATDMGIMPFTLKKLNDGIWEPTTNPSYDPVLRKPNEYQTAQQFREAWVLSKLIQGNAYILKRRDARNVVTGLYVLDPTRVLPMVSDSGAVFYKLQHDRLNKLPEGMSEMDLTIPASEIIHDRCIALHHWLIGVPPLCAAYWPALKNLKILKSAADFFANNAQPGGILTAPAGMSEDDANRIKAYWDTANADGNAGKVAVVGADLKFTSFAMKGADSQLVEQMRYSDEQICQSFGVPPFKVGIGSIPAGLGVDAINLLYFENALQTHIEAMENLLDEGMRIPPEQGLWMDLEPLLRMDVGRRAEVVTKLIGGKALTPDEGRKMLGYGKTGGGDTLWGQHQDHPLGMLAKRTDLLENAPPTEPVEPSDDEARKALARLRDELDSQIAALPVIGRSQTDRMRELATAH
jgi:HK97 family phage portal protein